MREHPAPRPIRSPPHTHNVCLLGSVNELVLIPGPLILNQRRLIGTAQKLRNILRVNILAQLLVRIRANHINLLPRFFIQETFDECENRRKGPWSIYDYAGCEELREEVLLHFGLLLEHFPNGAVHIREPKIRKVTHNKYLLNLVPVDARAGHHYVLLQFLYIVNHESLEFLVRHYLKYLLHVKSALPHYLNRSTELIHAVVPPLIIRLHLWPFFIDFALKKHEKINAI